MYSNSNHRNLLLFFPALFVIASIQFPGFSCQSDITCIKPFRCGGIRNLSIPFWSGGRPPSCGRPGFELTNCHGNDSVPLLNISSLTYRVLEIDFPTRTLKVARHDLWNSLCPEILRNTTMDPDLFEFSGNENISLYFGCTASKTTTAKLKLLDKFSCDFDSKTVNLYQAAGNHVLSGEGNGFSCESNIFVLVNHAAARTLKSQTAPSIDDLRAAFAAGFYIRWREDHEERRRLVQAPNGSIQPNELHKTCGSTFNCGSRITKIGYPFRGLQDPPQCGHPSFVLTCDHEKNVTNISITSTKFRVLEIDETTQTMRISREDMMEGTNCPTEIANTTLDFNLFDYAAAYQNYTFLYGCKPGLRIPGSFHTPCGINGSSDDGVFIISGAYGPGEECKEGVVVPGPPLEPETGGYGNVSHVNVRVFQEGFLIRWKTGSKACSGCTASGGRCGYDLEVNQTTCYCADPPYVSDTCGAADGDSSDSAVSSGSKVSAGSIAGIALGITAAIIIITIVIYCLKRRRLPFGPKQLSDGDVENFLHQHGSLALKRYKYSEIKKITKSFSNKLGQGGYGSVYKGMLPDESLVAVKLLIEMNSNGEEFINEVASISRTSHINIVNLLGFCFDKNKRALVYEFMPNKSLDKFISNNADCQLDLEKLYEIAVGVAKGLEYLHLGCNTSIIHFDIKPQNILLDEDLHPKIADFGLAKLCKKKQSILSTLGVGTRGTVGYIAPEVFSRNFGRVSHKSDVYSYGMMILEMAGGRKIEEVETVDSSEDYFPDKLYEHVVVDATRKLNNFMAEEKEERAKKLFLVGFWCIQTAPSDRPSMSKVVEMLEGNLQSIPIPPKPFLFCPNPAGYIFSPLLSEHLETENSE